MLWCGQNQGPNWLAFGEFRTLPLGSYALENAFQHHRQAIGQKKRQAAESQQYRWQCGFPANESWLSFVRWITTKGGMHLSTLNPKSHHRPTWKQSRKSFNLPFHDLAHFEPSETFPTRIMAYVG
jgi:hypothetical protein